MLDAIFTMLWIGAAISALFAQIAGFAIHHSSLKAQVTRVLVLVIWVLTLCAAQAGLLVFNYCESNCPSGLNAPTAVIWSMLSAVNIGVIWLTLKLIPKKFKRGPALFPPISTYDAGFHFTKMDGAEVNVKWADIHGVEALKKGIAQSDEFCLIIALEFSPHQVEVSERQSGFSTLVAELEQRLEFPLDWRAAVLESALETGRISIYCRSITGDFQGWRTIDMVAPHSSVTTSINQAPP